MKLTVLCVGKKHDASLAVAIDDYTARISRTWPTDWLVVPPSGAVRERAQRVETDTLLGRLKPSDKVWLLDERGDQISSPQLASKLDDLQTHGTSHLVLVIGGAYGVDERLRERAQFVWSLSSLVYAHQIVRLVLAEQLYRASQILAATAYHHE